MNISWRQRWLLSNSECEKISPHCDLNEREHHLMVVTYEINVAYKIMVLPFILIRGRSQTTLTRFWLFWPPTPRRWHFLTYKRWQKVKIFGLPSSTYPPLVVNVCERSLYRTWCYTFFYLIQGSWWEKSWKKSRKKSW